jgi:hypothetical protein
MNERNSEKKDGGRAKDVPTGYERYQCQIDCYDQRDNDYGGSEIDVAPSEVPVGNDFEVNIEIFGQGRQLNRSTVGVVLDKAVSM